MYVILLLILCKVESSIERKGEFTEKEEHPIFASFIDCIADNFCICFAFTFCHIIVSFIVLI